VISGLLVAAVRRFNRAPRYQHYWGWVTGRPCMTHAQWWLGHIRWLWEMP